MESAFVHGAARTGTDVRAGGSHVRFPRQARTPGFSRRLHKAARMAGERASVEGKRGVGRSGRWGECAAAARGGARRSARGCAGRGGVGFQSAGDSGRGPKAGSLPAEAAAQRRLCSLQEGRAAQRPFASVELSGSAPSGLHRPARWRQGRTRVPAPRPPRPLLPASPSLPRPLLAGGTCRAGVCRGCFGSLRFSPLPPDPAPRQVSTPGKSVLAAGAAAVRASFLDIKGSPRRSVRPGGPAAAFKSRAGGEWRSLGSWGGWSAVWAPKVSEHPRCLTRRGPSNDGQRGTLEAQRQHQRLRGES